MYPKAIMSGFEKKMKSPKTFDVVSATLSVKRLFIMLLLMTAVTIFTLITYKYSLFLSMTEPERISYLWKIDMENLEAHKLLPKELRDLSSFKIITTSKLSKSWAPTIQAPFQTTKNGKYHLEILLLDLEEPDLRGVVIQMNLTSVKDQLHIWELGRTYSLKKTFLESLFF